jgi:hypothetical protein
MTTSDLLKHALFTRRMWSEKSLAMRREFINPNRARRMSAPDENGCIGTMRYRRAINQFAVPYIDRRGFMRHKIFYISRDQLNDVVAVYKIRDEAVAFAKKLLDTGDGTPIRRRYRKPFHVREVNPITRYFSHIESARNDDATATTPNSQ